METDALDTLYDLEIIMDEYEEDKDKVKMNNGIDEAGNLIIFVQNIQLCKH